MDSRACPKTPQCPIFNGLLKGTEYTSIYQNLYCLNEELGRTSCKRYQVATKVGKCPNNVLPNSTKSVDEIIAEMQKRGELDAVKQMAK